MRTSVAVLFVLLLFALNVAPASAATCADYANQAAAQKAKDTRDADGDGIYCESLPCPCAKPGSGSTTPKPTITSSSKSCKRTKGIVNVSFSGTKYPHIRQHTLDAIAAGWPLTLVLNRPGADRRRDRLLRGVPTKAGYDRDEYPPAVGRGRGKGLKRGSDPVGWKADVQLVPSSENRSHGSTLGAKLRRFCNGVKFRYVFY